MTEPIDENNLAVNQAIRSAFSRAGEPLSCTCLYILGAMLWGLKNDAAEWADGKTHWSLESQVVAMLSWRPRNVMAMIYNDGDGYDEASMKLDAENFTDETPKQIASSLLETLMHEMD